MNGWSRARAWQVAVEETDAHFGNVCPPIPDWLDPSSEHEAAAQAQRRMDLIAALRDRGPALPLP